LSGRYALLIQTIPETASLSSLDAIDFILSNAFYQNSLFETPTLLLTSVHRATKLFLPGKWKCLNGPVFPFFNVKSVDSGL